MYVLRTTTDSEFLVSWYAHFYRIFPNEKHHDVDALYKNKRKTPCEFGLMMTIMTGVLEIANTKRTESVSKKYAEERGQKENARSRGLEQLGFELFVTFSKI